MHTLALQARVPGPSTAPPARTRTCLLLLLRHAPVIPRLTALAALAPLLPMLAPAAPSSAATLPSTSQASMNAPRVACPRQVPALPRPCVQRPGGARHARRRRLRALRALYPPLAALERAGRVEGAAGALRAAEGGGAVQGLAAHGAGAGAGRGRRGGSGDARLEGERVLGYRDSLTAGPLRRSRSRSESLTWA